MFKNSKKIIVLSIIIFLFTSPFASATTFTDNQIVNKYKKWTITCNQEILESSINEAITVLDSSNNNINDIFVHLEENGKIIIVDSPITGYIEGDIYKLVINTNLKSIENIPLKSNIEVNFSIENSTSDTNISDKSTPISVLTESEILAIGAAGFTGTDQEIAEQIRTWQINNMIYANAEQNYPDVSYSMRWNYAFPQIYTTNDMLENMKDGNKYYGICYHYATVFSSIAQYYGLDVRVTNTVVKPSDVANNPFYTATSNGLSLTEYEAFSEWITTKGLNTADYPYEAVRLVMAETALHYRAEVKLSNTWTRFDQYDSVTEGSTDYEFIVTNWEEGYQETVFDDYVNRINNGEDLRGEGYSSSYEEFLEGRLIKIETGEVDLFEGITDDAGNEHRASTIDELMQGLGLIPYYENKEDILNFYNNAEWVNEEIDELFEIKENIEAENDEMFYVICDLIIFSEVEEIDYDAYVNQYLGFTDEEVTEEIFNTFIK